MPRPQPTPAGSSRAAGRVGVCEGQLGQREEIVAAGVRGNRRSVEPLQRVVRAAAERVREIAPLEYVLTEEARLARVERAPRQVGAHRARRHPPDANRRRTPGDQEPECEGAGRTRNPGGSSSAVHCSLAAHHGAFLRASRRIVSSPPRFEQGDAPSRPGRTVDVASPVLLEDRRMGGGTSGAAALVRGALFFGLWTGLIGTGHPLMGLAIAVLATAVSLRLLPPSTKLRLASVPAFAAHFAWQSIAAGWDVARRALDPALPIRPGFVSLPGTIPSRDRPQRLHAGDEPRTGHGARRRRRRVDHLPLPRRGTARRRAARRRRRGCRACSTHQHGHE